METVFLLRIIGGLILGIVMAIIFSHAYRNETRLRTLGYASLSWIFGVFFSYLISILSAESLNPVMIGVGWVTSLLILALYK